MSEYSIQAGPGLAATDINQPGVLLNAFADITFAEPKNFSLTGPRVGLDLNLDTSFLSNSHITVRGGYVYKSLVSAEASVALNGEGHPLFGGVVGLFDGTRRLIPGFYATVLYDPITDRTVELAGARLTFLFF